MTPPSTSAIEAPPYEQHHASAPASIYPYNDRTDLQSSEMSIANHSEPEPEQEPFPPLPSAETTTPVDEQNPNAPDLGESSASPDAHQNANDATQE